MRRVGAAIRRSPTTGFLSPLSVANIAFETTEEQLREVLLEVGPVASLKCSSLSLFLCPLSLSLFLSLSLSLPLSCTYFHLPLSLPPPRLIYDPASGKPRGFGFCEFKDAETAMSAVRNLAGRELNGRPLRIDSAANAPGEGFRGHTHSAVCTVACNIIIMYVYTVYSICTVYTCILYLCVNLCLRGQFSFAVGG